LPPIRDNIAAVTAVRSRRHFVRCLSIVRVPDLKAKPADVGQHQVARKLDMFRVIGASSKCQFCCGSMMNPTERRRVVVCDRELELNQTLEEVVALTCFI